MIEICTYIGNDPKNLKPFHETEHYDGDIDYVEGSIQLTIDGRVIFRSDFIEDVNCFWPFFIVSLTELKANHKAEGAYTSINWPFEMEMLEDDKVLIKVGYPSDPDSISATCQYSKFIKAVKVEVERFYNIAYRLGIYSEAEFLSRMNVLHAL